MSIAQATQINIQPYLAGCGMRRHGMAYLDTHMGEWLEKYDLNHFVFDPPILVEDLADWGLCAQGVSYIEQNGITHAMTVVGRDSYPNVADILEEWANGYASTLVPQIGDGIHKLSKESRLLVFHSAGWIENWNTYRAQYLKTPRPPCLLKKGSVEYRAHIEGNEMCAGLHWQNVFTGVRYLKHDRYVTRTIGDTTYEAVGPIKDEMPVHKYALVAWRPIDSIIVIDNEEIGDKTPVEKALEFLASQTAIPIYIANH